MYSKTLTDSQHCCSPRSPAALASPFRVPAITRRHGTTLGVCSLCAHVVAVLLFSPRVQAAAQLHRLTSAMVRRAACPSAARRSSPLALPYLSSSLSLRFLRSLFSLSLLAFPPFLLRPHPAPLHRAGQRPRRNRQAPGAAGAGTERRLRCKVRPLSSLALPRSLLVGFSLTLCPPFPAPRPHPPPGCPSETACRLL